MPDNPLPLFFFLTWKEKRHQRKFCDIWVDGLLLLKENLSQGEFLVSPDLFSCQMAGQVYQSVYVRKWESQEQGRVGVRVCPHACTHTYRIHRATFLYSMFLVILKQKRELRGYPDTYSCVSCMYSFPMSSDNSPHPGGTHNHCNKRSCPVLNFSETEWFFFFVSLKIESRGWCWIGFEILLRDFVVHQIPLYPLIGLLALLYKNIYIWNFALFPLTPFTF